MCFDFQVDLELEFFQLKEPDMSVGYYGRRGVRVKGSTVTAGSKKDHTTVHSYKSYEFNVVVDREFLIEQDFNFGA